MSNLETTFTTAGWVVSDLHLLARRSAGRERMHELLPDLRTCRTLVLNGDIVDFKWSTSRTHAESVRRSIDWLSELLAALPSTNVHYVLGNHDCLAEFPTALDQLSATNQRFRWHEFNLRLGDALFLHGDCTHWPMNRAGLERFRATWRRSRRRGTVATRAYQACDAAGLTRWVHRRHFPVDRTLARLQHHLDDALPDWQKDIRQVYFGHTHEPFEDAERGGVRFHNTGSAIRGMPFQPLRFYARHE